jgi:hypothetical protein
MYQRKVETMIEDELASSARRAPGRPRNRSVAGISLRWARQF